MPPGLLVSSAVHAVAQKRSVSILNPGIICDLAVPLLLLFTLISDGGRHLFIYLIG